ncbi:hypothetical protein BS50DRAFT_588175 [Corynespora cassiicola Philippines]|uniref:FAD/NAD(P)-binding domain-containing protein n=1 Tax=Corynespora cassiicola Philippines TaxID=1448308 RepID=A0A2T2NP28_CORCC|nr:hypothetical protein BS50DRAFT_588175 [Corynespora cassiicola Philippines]
MAENISPDYLVIGAGAMGMAFVDTLIADTKATVAMVDRYARPGGHWTIAYPFVTLHQPSSVYGVNSRHLGEDKIDKVGLNKGMLELATGDEVCAYFSKVMHQTFLPSGQVTYYPKHEYMGEGKFRSIITDKSFQVGQHTRIVDATYMKVMVPAMRPPPYEVSRDVNLITPNDLTTISRPYGGYTVVGAGKTGVDAVLWLIANGIDPKDISWIMPRDQWFWQRGIFQLEQIAAEFAKTGEAINNATSTEDLFLRFESYNQVLRLDKNVWPTMFSEVTLEKGTYKPKPDSLYIDCTADGLAKLEPVPIFNGKHITLQSVRFCQQVLSAAVIAHVEATYDNDDVKNALCGVVPHPDETTDYINVSLQTYRNRLRWLAEPKMASWLMKCRLDVFALPSLSGESVGVKELEARELGICQSICDGLDKFATNFVEAKA